jgi:hypothetical protein
MDPFSTCKPLPRCPANMGRRRPSLLSLTAALPLQVQHKVGLLKDIPRTIGFGEGTQPGQETSRKVGPKLSEKVYRFLTARDPTMMIEEVLDKGS